MLDSLSAYNTVPVNMARSLHLNPALELERAAPEATSPLAASPLDARPLSAAPLAPSSDGFGFQFAPFSASAPVGFAGGLDLQENVWESGPFWTDFQAASRAYEGVG